MSFKKKTLTMLLAFVMAIGMVVPAFASSVTSSGGTGAIPVEVDADAMVFSVTVPTTLPISVDSAGIVTTAPDCAIVNNSAAPVAVSSVSMLALNGWTLKIYQSNLPKMRTYT